MKDLPVNLCATLAMDPLGEARGHLVYGPAVMISRKKESPDLSLDDWKNICNGVWYDESLVDKNVNGKFRA